MKILSHHLKLWSHKIRFDHVALVLSEAVLVIELVLSLRLMGVCLFVCLGSRVPVRAAWRTLIGTALSGSRSSRTDASCLGWWKSRPSRSSWGPVRSRPSRLTNWRSSGRYRDLVRSYGVKTLQTCHFEHYNCIMFVGKPNSDPGRFGETWSGWGTTARSATLRRCLSVPEHFWAAGQTRGWLRQETQRVPSMKTFLPFNSISVQGCPELISKMSIGPNLSIIFNCSVSALLSLILLITVAVT